ncbi:MAG: DUF1285 domain-containing protein [Alphaproteobacteria bacterium]|nr:DUF1285 domain-containing protein [Alphaproteobacteria bacterium]
MSDILAKLAAKIGEQGDVGFAPVELWSPEYCGELDIEIKANGDWFYMGTLIKRQKLVKLFTTVLWRDVETNEHYLITPVEKIKIKAADAAFIATDMVVDGTGANQSIAVQTNLAGQVVINDEHKIRFSHQDDQFMAYVDIRYGLEAKLTRSLCYQLADYMVERDGKFILISDKCEFEV